jgi:hypothetical protein
MPRALTRGEYSVAWIESWCATPGGKPVRLSVEQRATIYRLFDGGLETTQVSDHALAAYLVLLHLAGPEARPGAPPPPYMVDVFTLWTAAAPDLRRYLRRHGETVTCPELGTYWSRAA